MAPELNCHRKEVSSTGQALIYANACENLTDCMIHKLNQSRKRRASACQDYMFKSTVHNTRLAILFHIIDLHSR